MRDAVGAGRVNVLISPGSLRPVSRLRSKAGTGFIYVTRKNGRSGPERMVLRKYEPVIRRHMEFRDER